MPNRTVFAISLDRISRDFPYSYGGFRRIAAKRRAPEDPALSPHPRQPPLAIGAAILLVLIGTGCRTASDWRESADESALRIIEQTRESAFGEAAPFTIERPADTLRRRLLLDQDLPRASVASMGWQELEPIDHWPEDSGPAGIDATDAQLEQLSAAITDEGVELSLVDALRIAAANSREYQSEKENVFRAALTLDLQAWAFENQFQGLISGEIESSLDRDALGDRVRDTGALAGSDLSVSRVFTNGISLTSRIGLDVARLLTPDAFTGERSNSVGVFGDTSITIPLMRGAGRHIAAEPLIQAERSTLYAILDFERFKQLFVVQVLSQYLSVVQQTDRVRNNEQNYKSLVTSARQLRRLADAGRRPELEVDQAVQDELRARNAWVSAIQAYKRQLDNFRILLGLPTDAAVRLRRGELAELTERMRGKLGSWSIEEDEAPRGPVDPRDLSGPVMTRGEDEEIILPPPGRGEKGPWELDERRAVEIALDNRLDLVIADGDVYDRQRQLVIAADALRAEVTLLGSASFGETRPSTGSATLDDSKTLRTSEADYDALLNIDLPLNRLPERNGYRDAWIVLDRATRDLQELEDRVKLEVRDALRTLLEAREGLGIQQKAVALAGRRVASTRLFLDAGRAQTRDLLEAQEDFVAAQNDLTSALVEYRIAELELQRDMGVLRVDERGLFEELDPTEL